MSNFEAVEAWCSSGDYSTEAGDEVTDVDPKTSEERIGRPTAVLRLREGRRHELPPGGEEPVEP